jgi:hypothetical protein
MILAKSLYFADQNVFLNMAAGAMIQRRFIFSIRRNFFWHTSCGSYSVAKKFNALGMVCNAADNAAMQLRLATMQLAGLRIPPRVRTVPMMRRRLPVVFVPESTQPVKIRHTSQNLGSPVNETRPSQSPRV